MENYFGFNNGKYELYGKNGEYFYIFGNDYANSIGKGSFGEVYKGYNSKNELCAIKKINKGTGLPNEVIDRELEIMEKIAKKNTPKTPIFNIIYSINYYEDDKQLLLVMPYCTGDFENIVKEWAKNVSDIHSLMNDERDIIEYFRQICYGTRILHSLGYMHRDLKLGNILYNNDAENKEYPFQYTLILADLGLSRSNLAPEFTTKVGTGLTIAPEVFGNDKNYDIKSDVYSLGCMLLKMLINKYPIEISDKGKLEQYPTSIDLTSYQLCDFTLFILEGCLQHTPKNRMHWNYLYKLLNIETLYTGYLQFDVHPYSRIGNGKIDLKLFNRKNMLSTYTGESYLKNLIGKDPSQQPPN